MSHITGTVQVLSPSLTIGPGVTTFNPAPAPGGTKLLILHFQNLNFLPGDQLQVNLGYAVDTFTAADGPAFWTRPINVYAFPAGVQITYVAAGPPGGSVELFEYGRGNGTLPYPIPPTPVFQTATPSINRLPMSSRRTIRSGTARNRRIGKTLPALRLLPTCAPGWPAAW